MCLVEKCPGWYLCCTGFCYARNMCNLWRLWLSDGSDRSGAAVLVVSCAVTVCAISGWFLSKRILQVGQLYMRLFLGLQCCLKDDLVIESSHPRWTQLLHVEHSRASSFWFTGLRQMLHISGSELLSYSVVRSLSTICLWFASAIIGQHC